MIAGKAVITSLAVDLPSGQDNHALEKGYTLYFHDFREHRWYSPELDQSIIEMAGDSIRTASFSADSIDAMEKIDLKRRTSVLLFYTVKRLLEKAGLKKIYKSKKIGIAKALGYSFFTSDAYMNPFNFKANLEHQTPAPIGKWFNCTGPQFVFKEGDNCDLTGIDFLSSSIDSLPCPMIVAGISEPHPLLTSMEVIHEGKESRSTPDDLVEMNLRFCEGTAAILLESQLSAERQKRLPLARIEASRQSMRSFDYRNRQAIEDHIEKNIEILLNQSSGSIQTVFGCFRRTGIVADIERRVLVRLLPHAKVISTVDCFGDLGPIAGLVDIAYALVAWKNNGASRGTNKDEVLLHKISRMGHYAGIVLKSLV